MPEQMKIVLMRESDFDYLAGEIPAFLRSLARISQDFNLSDEVRNQFYRVANDHANFVKAIWDTGFDAVETHTEVPGFTEFVTRKVEEMMGSEFELRLRGIDG